MPNWLTKATGGLSRKTDDVPQTFQLTCECAEQHAGQRKGRSQRIICQTCGAALFVLPKNVYPPLKTKTKGPPKKKKKSGKRRQDGPPTGGLPSVNEMAGAFRSGLLNTVGGIGRGVAAGGRKLRDGIVSVATRIAKSLRELFTPFRLVLAAMAVMLLATGYTALRSRMVENSRETFRTELAAGQSALAEDDLLAAREHFAAAAAAADTLGTDDPQSMLVRQLHHEVTAITRLAPQSLFAILDEAEKSQGRTASLSWDDKFLARYEGTWLVLQAPIRHEASGFVLDLPLTVGQSNRKVTVMADLACFTRLTPTDGIANVIFAAPVIGCALNNAKDEWTLTLGPDAGFLWSNIDNLRRIGFLASDATDEDEIAALLKTQADIIGGTP